MVSRTLTNQSNDTYNERVQEIARVVQRSSRKIKNLEATLPQAINKPQDLDQKRQQSSKFGGQLQDAWLHKRLLEERIEEFENKVLKANQTRSAQSDSDDSDF
jgi:hypothetical protein